MVDIASVCVFCGSSTPQDTRYREAARALGTLVASKGISLVYGGGRIGMMGALADAALVAGGRVVGVIPTGLFSREVAHTELTELHEVDSMHERKQLMLEELAEVTTWSQLGLHAKPVVLLDVDRFWDPLAAQLDRMVAVGLLKPSNRVLIQRASSPEDALASLAAARPPREARWITPRER